MECRQDAFKKKERKKERTASEPERKWKILRYEIPVRAS
jgi:hypothetical protein